MSKEIEKIHSQPLLDDDILEVDEAADTDPGPLHAAPKRRRKPFLITTSIILLVILLGGGVLYWQFGRKSAVQFIQTAVTTGNLSVNVSSIGPINATVYNLNFTATSGQVSEIDVKIGDSVKKGQTLAKLKIDTTSLQDNVKQAQLGVTSAQHNLDSANSSSDDSQVQTAKDNLEKAKAQLQAAQHNLDTAKAGAILTAPADGTIAAINGSVGQSASSQGGSSSSSGFIVLTNTSTLTIQALVNEADIANVKTGQAVQFTVAAYSGITFKGTVSAVQTIGSTSSSVVSYTVLINVDNSSLNGKQLYQGMTATVNITTASRTNALLIPSSALSFPSVALQNGEIDRSTLTSMQGNSQRGQNQGQNNQSSSQDSTQSAGRIVLVLQNGKLTPVVIKTGLSSGQYTEVLSGLKAGDKVVTSQIGGNTTTSSNSSSNRNNNGPGGGDLGGGGNPPGNGAPPSGAGGR